MDKHNPGPPPPPPEGTNWNVELGGENPWPAIAVLVIGSIVVVIGIWQGWR